MWGGGGGERGKVAYQPSAAGSGRQTAPSRIIEHGSVLMGIDPGGGEDNCCSTMSDVSVARFMVEK